MEADKKNAVSKFFASFDKSMEFILAIGLIVIIVVVVLLFLFNRSNLDNNQNGDVVASFPQPVISPNNSEVINVTDDKVIENITLGEDWRVITILKDFTDHIEYECESTIQTECIVYYVTDSETTFYISSPTALKSKISIQTSSEEKNISISGIDRKFTYSKVNFYIRDEEGAEVTEDSSKVVYKEISGCVADQLCINSGLLNIYDEEENRKQVEKFENFLRNLQIS